MDLDKPKYSYSLDGERYYGSFETRREAHKAALLAFKEEYPEQELLDVECWTGSIKPVAWTCDAERIIENISEEVYSEVGEVAEDWIPINHDQIMELEKTLNTEILKWMHKHGYWPPHFWGIDQIVRVNSKANDNMRFHKSMGALKSDTTGDYSRDSEARG